MKLFKQSILAGLLLSSLVACGTSADGADNFVQSGKGLLAEGKVDKARLEFKNAIQIDPRMAEPFYQLALLDEKEQKWKSMFANLKTVEQLDPNHFKAIIKLGQISLLGGNLEQATAKADKVIAADESNVEAWVLRASIAMKQQKLVEAMTAAEQALSIDPKSLEALSVKSVLLRQQDKPLQALSTIDQALSFHPDKLPLVMIKLSILEGQKNYKAIEDIYRNLLRERPDANWVALALAKLLNSQDRYDDAKQVLETFVANHPEDKKAKILYVSLVKTKDPAAAINMLQSYIASDLDNYELRFILAKLQYEQGKKNASLENLEKIVSMDTSGSNGIQAQIILATYALENNETEVALDKVNKVLEHAAENEDALLLRARINLAKKQADQAMPDLRVVLRNNPASEKALMLMAQAYSSLGSQELADDKLRQALAVNPSNTFAALSVANNLMQKKEIDKAEEVLTAALDKATDEKAPLLQALAQVRVMKKDWKGMTSVIDSLREDNKDTAFTHYLKGQVAQGESKFDLAVSEYKLALEQQADMPRALQGLAGSMMASGKKEALISYLNEYIGLNKTNYAAYGMLSTIYIQDENWEKAGDILEKGISEEPKWQGGYGSLASIYLSQNNVSAAEAVYQRGLDANQDSTFLMLQKATLHERNQQFKKAVALYENALTVNPEIEPAINNLASLLSDHFLTDENLKKAATLTKRFEKSEQPYYVDTYAWTQVLQGNYKKAQTLLERVVSLSPDVAVFNYHIGVLHLKQGNQLEAKNYLNIAKSLAEKEGDKITADNIEKALESI